MHKPPHTMATASALRIGPADHGRMRRVERGEEMMRNWREELRMVVFNLYIVNEEEINTLGWEFSLWWGGLCGRVVLKK